MKIVIAPDSFKGTLSAAQVCDIVAEAALSADPSTEVVRLPMADGGEGTVDCLLSVLRGKRQSVHVQGPLVLPGPVSTVDASYGIFDGNKAVMEMASASGFHLVNKNMRDIMHSNTYGTGQMFMDAVSRGCRTVYMGIGGSATNDGGLGFAAALGARFLDRTGRELAPVPSNLMRIEGVDLSDLDGRIAGLADNPGVRAAGSGAGPDADTARLDADPNSEGSAGASGAGPVRLIVMSDVTNPLLGSNGCAHVFAMQKGATSPEIEELERGMYHFSKVIKRETGRDMSATPGAGAAGGLGYGLLTFAGAEIRSGVDAVMDMVGFKEKAAGADLVVTGEGRMDAQSAQGKVASGVSRACRLAGVPCIAIVGDLGEGYESMYDLGLNRIIKTRKNSMTVEYAMEHAAELLRETAEDYFVHGPIEMPTTAN